MLSAPTVYSGGRAWTRVWAAARTSTVIGCVQERRPGEQPARTPEEVNVHDFPDKELGKAIPYGIYYVSAGTGRVSVGTDTSAFAVATLRTWWDSVGRARYAGADRLLICVDGCGSNRPRVRAWKIELAALPLVRHDFHGDWNYSLLPRDTPE